MRTPTGDATPLDVLTELSTALTARGLRVEVDRKIWSVTAQNPAAKDLRQVVRLGGKDGEPTWFWEWSGPTGTPRRSSSRCVPRTRSRRPPSVSPASWP
jgi:hypothetical protein